VSFRSPTADDTLAASLVPTMTILTGRRKLMAMLGGLAMMPLMALAQPELTKIGVLRDGNAVPVADLPIVQELAKVGYVEGRSVTYVFRATGGDPSRLPQLAHEIVAAKPDIIVAGGSPAALALFNVTHDIPVVITVLADPVALGLTDSMAHPSHNVTGFTVSSLSLTAKRLQLMHEILPTLQKSGYFWVPDSPLAQRRKEQVEQAAKVLGISLVSIPVQSAADIEGAFTRADQEQVKAVLIESDPVMLRVSSAIADHCLLYNLPCMHFFPEEVRNGGLISYGPAAIENISGAAAYVERLIKGAKVAELPFVDPTDIKLVINLRTARSLGIKIPPSVMIRADEVIE